MFNIMLLSFKQTKQITTKDGAAVEIFRRIFNLTTVCPVSLTFNV